MARMIVVNEKRYKELCADYLRVSKKYKQALGVISNLVTKLERMRTRSKKCCSK